MTRLICLLGAVLTCFGLVAAPAEGAPAGEPTIGGLAVTYLPHGLGGSTDFEYHFARVSFASRVWESGSDADGWRVDLDIQVMHGAHMNDAHQLHDWFIHYEQRPPAEARYMQVIVQGHRGWACRDEVFWLVHPGLAVSVLIDRPRWSRWALFRIADGIRVPQPAASPVDDRN